MPKLPDNIGREVFVKESPTVSEPVGKLGDYVGETFRLRGPDGSGKDLEWIVKPTGSHSFELIVPDSHELGTPDAWENISVMTQRVTRASADGGGCGCDGNQCGCQGQNCGTNCNAQEGRLTLVREFSPNLPRLATLRQRYSDLAEVLGERSKE